MKNPTTTMFLHQNVILNNKPYAYNQATRTYQEAKFQHQPQPQQVVYVQPQHQFQQAYGQPQQIFYNNPQQQQQVAYNYPPTKVFYNNVPPQPQQAYGQLKPVFHVQPQQVFYSNPPQQVACNYPTKLFAKALQSKQDNYQLQKNNHTNGNMLDMFESVDSVAYSLCSSININDLNNLAKAYDKSNSSETNNLNSRSTSPGSVVLNPFVSFGPLQQQLQR